MGFSLCWRLLLVKSRDEHVRVGAGRVAVCGSWDLLRVV